MTISYTTSLRLSMMAGGDNPGTWWTINNANIGTLLEQAIAGVTYATFTSDANRTLTASNGAADEARSAVLVLTSSVSLTAVRTLTIPAVNKVYLVWNQTTGSQAVRISCGAGATVDIRNGFAATVFCNGSGVWKLTPDTAFVSENVATAAAAITNLSAATLAVSGDASANTLTLPVAPWATPALRLGYSNVGLSCDSPYRIVMNSGGNWCWYGAGGDLYVRGNVFWSSDERTKREIKPAKIGLRQVLKLQPSTWKREDTGRRVYLGIVAQDAKAADRRLVTTDKDGLLAPNLQGMIAALVGSIHDLKAEVDALKAQVKALRRA